MDDAFVDRIKQKFEDYMADPEAIKYIFLKYRKEIDMFEHHDFSQMFTDDRLENEDSREYFQGLETYQKNLEDYAHMLQEHDYSFLFTDYFDDEIDHFFGNPLIIATIIREKKDIMCEIFTPDQFIIVNAIAEINLRHNKLHESVIKLRELNCYKSLWKDEVIQPKAVDENAEKNLEASA